MAPLELFVRSNASQMDMYVSFNQLSAQLTYRGLDTLSQRDQLLEDVPEGA
jgi:hypothetical protein